MPSVDNRELKQKTVRLGI